MGTQGVIGSAPSQNGLRPNPRLMTIPSGGACWPVPLSREHPGIGVVRDGSGFTGKLAGRDDVDAGDGHQEDIRRLHEVTTMADERAEMVNPTYQYGSPAGAPGTSHGE